MNRKDLHERYGIRAPQRDEAAAQVPSEIGTALELSSRFWPKRPEGRSPSPKRQGSPMSEWSDFHKGRKTQPPTFRLDEIAPMP